MNSDHTTKDDILQAATQEFAEFGFEGSRVDRIAKRANLNKAMIYYYFGKKEVIYETILGIICVELYESFSSLMTMENEQTERIEIFFEKYIEFLNSIKDDTFRIVIREMASSGDYFKKVFFPKLVYPASLMIISLFERWKVKKPFIYGDTKLILLHLFYSITFCKIIHASKIDASLFKALPEISGVYDFNQYLMSIINNRSVKNAL